MAEPSVHGRIYSVFRKAIPACVSTMPDSEEYKMIHKQYHKQRHEVSDGILEGIQCHAPVVPLQQPHRVLQEAQAKGQGANQVNTAGHACDKGSRLTASNIRV